MNLKSTRNLVKEHASQLPGGNEAAFARSFPYAVTDSSAVGQVRRATAELAAMMNLPTTESGKLGIIVTEAANNLLKHAKGGEIILRCLRDEAGIEIIALDKGPGMSNLENCFRDGYSTSGTQGTGLGAIRRLAHTFDIFSAPNHGTALVAQVVTNKNSTPLKLLAGAVCVPVLGEQQCGDGWQLKWEGNKIRVCVADGLGHGALAAEASQLALTIFDDRDDSLSDLLARMHAALKATRGAAVALTELDLERMTSRFAGLGNVAGFLCEPNASRHLVSQHGTVGHHFHTVQEFSHPISKGTLLILHSDGINTRWEIAKYPGLHFRHPSLIAAILYRDFRRTNDDASIVVARINP